MGLSAEYGNGWKRGGRKGEIEQKKKGGVSLDSKGAVKMTEHRVTLKSSETKGKEGGGEKEAIIKKSLKLGLFDQSCGVNPHGFHFGTREA